VTAVADIVTALRGRRAGSQWLARCPAHADDTASLSIGEGDDGKTLVHCHAGCSQERVIEALQRLNLWSGEARELTEAELAAMRQATVERQRAAQEKQERALALWRSTVPVIALARTEARDVTPWQGAKQNIAAVDAAIWRGGDPEKDATLKVEWRPYSTPAEAYLRSRQINPDLCLYENGYPDTLGWCADALGDPLNKPRGALVAAVCDEVGQVQAIQRIFLTEEGVPMRGKDGKKAKWSLGPIGGNAWQPSAIGDPQGRWGLAEGIESAMAAMQLFRFPVWAAISAANLPHVQPPVWARDAVVFADNDRLSTGYKAARKAWERLRNLPRLEKARIWMSNVPGYDVADQLAKVRPYV